MKYGKEIKRILGSVRKTADKYNMISDNDKIAVGVSGGKDSLALLCAMAELRRFYEKSFDLCAIYVDTAFYNAGYGIKEDMLKATDDIRKFCDELNVPFHTVKTDIAEIVFKEKEEKNPCSLCSKMRRGALQSYASELGCNKLALGHHFDDAVETFVMNLFNEGRIGCFPPVVTFDKHNITVIRPFVNVLEKEITYFSNKASLPVTKSPCPVDKTTERENIKKLLRQLDKKNRGLKQRIYGAMERANVDGYIE